VNAGRRVLDFSDVDSAKWQTYADRAVWPLNCIYRSEARRVRQLEQRCAEQQDICIVVNDREQRKLLTHCDSACVEVLPVALAADEYPSDGPRPSAPRNPVVGFTGSMFYPPNIRAALWFGRHVWPIIRAKRPDAQWLVVGSRPASAVRRLAKLPGVSVTGSVADMRPLLARMRVFVNPVDGDIGVQTKLLVAMAAGVPAVVTPDAAAGIDYDGPPPFEIAASPTQFANAVLRLLVDDARAMELARRGREVIETRYDEATHYRRLETWLAGATDERASAESPARAARDLAGAAR